jgi:predicted nucleic acid-binding Zn finger protein
MTQFAPGRENGHDGRTDTELDARDVRALTECMSVLPEGGDIYTVVGENGGTYTVDARESRCTCPDYKHNLPTDDGRERCKHAARVAYATGERSVPVWVDTDAVDSQLGAHVDGGPRLETCRNGRRYCAELPGARDDAFRCPDCTAEAVATDGGIIDAGDDGDARPDDCDCGDWNAGLGLPCFRCYLGGFETPASAGAEEDADR